MHHEEERHQEWRERPQHRHPRHEQEGRQQHFRNRWDDPTPFNHDRENRERQEYYQSRAQQQHYFNREQRQQDQYREDIDRHQHGFSTDHHSPRMHEERREWRSEDHSFGPHNQHARDRWQQPEHMPPLREQRHRRHSRRDEDWDERGW